MAKHIPDDVLRKAIYVKGGDIYVDPDTLESFGFVLTPEDEKALLRQLEDRMFETAKVLFGTSDEKEGA